MTIRIAWTTCVLVAAALAGCTGGGDGEGQLPLPTEDDSPTTGPPTGGPSPNGNGTGSVQTSGNASLEVDPLNGTVPFNVTLRYDASGDANLTWTLQMWRSGAAPNGTAPPGNATGNATGNGTGNQTAGGNATGSPTTSATGTATGSPTTSPQGNQTGTGNQTTGSPSGNQTSGNQTDGPAGNRSLDGSSGADFTLWVNGTAADLPGVTVQRLNVSGTYEVVFAVTFSNGSTAWLNESVMARGMSPGTPLGNETRVFEGSFLASEPLLCLGAEEFEWALNSTFGEHMAVVDRINVSLDASGALDDYEMRLMAPNGTELASGPSFQLDGPLGAGNYTLAVESCVAADTEFTVTAVAEYVYALAPLQAPTEAAEG